MIPTPLKSLRISTLIRRLVDRYRFGRRPKRGMAQKLLTLSGLIHETKPDVAQRHDEYL